MEKGEEMLHILVEITLRAGAMPMFVFSMGPGRMIYT